MPLVVRWLLAIVPMMGSGSSAAPRVAAHLRPCARAVPSLLADAQVVRTLCGATTVTGGTSSKQLLWPVNSRK